MNRMTDTEIVKTARDLRAAMKMAEINPAKDSLASVIDKFRKRNWRHLMLHLENGGMLLLCANPEMSAMLHSAIERYDMEIVTELTEQAAGGVA